MTQVYNIELVEYNNKYYGIRCPELPKTADTGNFIIDFLIISDSITSNHPSGRINVSKRLQVYISNHYT